MAIRVMIWSEMDMQEELTDAVRQIRAVHPEGIHGTLRQQLSYEQDFEILTATLDQPDHGLSADVLDKTDVLIWWGHVTHELVSDEVVDRIQNRVLSGMGLIVLHSGHHSKIFRRLMGTTCSLKWREAAEKTRLWVVDPTHPIADGIGDYIELEHEEMYGEHFDIPTPDNLVFISWYKGGEVFRSGCCWKRGYGNIFYFSPGHETHYSYQNEQIIHVLKNAIRWASPRLLRTELGCPNVQPLEQI